MQKVKVQYAKKERLRQKTMWLLMSMAIEANDIYCGECLHNDWGCTTNNSVENVGIMAMLSEQRKQI